MSDGPSPEAVEAAAYRGTRSALLTTGYSLVGTVVAFFLCAFAAGMVLAHPGGQSAFRVAFGSLLAVLGVAMFLRAWRLPPFR